MAVIFSVGYQHVTMSKRIITPISHIRTTEEVGQLSIQRAWAVFIRSEIEYNSSASQLTSKPTDQFYGHGNSSPFTGSQLSGLCNLCSLTMQFEQYI